MKDFGYQDAVIIGGGPAGLSAALLLGRCLRKVVVCDAGQPRNRASRAMHGFIGLDGIPPHEFLEQARTQLNRYETVHYVNCQVNDVVQQATGFLVELEGGESVSGRTVLLATGLVDQLPDFPGFDRFYGISVHQCPYCDGWEHRSQAIGMLGADQDAQNIALELKIWSRDVTLYLDGVSMDSCRMTSLKMAGIKVVDQKILSLEGEGSCLKKIRLEGDAESPCDALFFSPRQALHSDLAIRMGCQIDHSSGAIHCHPDGFTPVQNLFVAGNASHGIQMAVVAAAEGVKAAAAINDLLMMLDHSYLA